ncbi:retrotransposon gag protein [Cucumis melo var. makuwa]|uniref:Retrotransposon gag protein n=1 Tax=Cucumis melo var. makuwa TaxID=1194695 RepID=A0A5D3CTZ8_CUCMM|nr:retrotransposon gag protein [Cucumis melo var. makuwa]TYK15341.1 retrotransposon gag protein [Cucumis melo var. makuwa]
MGEVREKTLRELAENTIDVAAGGALADKTPTEAWELISRMAENSQSFGNRALELDNSLTKECGVCGMVGHPNDKCPEVIEDVNIVQRYGSHDEATNDSTYYRHKQDGSNFRLNRTMLIKNESKEEKVETNPSPSNSRNDKSPLNDFTPYIPKPPFSSRFPKKKETPKEEELLEMLRKV